MGMRSQIYVRFNGELVIANYYGWNFGERMISRARHFIEYVNLNLKEGFDFLFKKPELERLRRYLDVNFDMQDIAISQNIFDEYAEAFYDNWKNGGGNLDLYDFIFRWQDNNDGKLLIDIHSQKNHEGGCTYQIKYAFLDSECNPDFIMDAAAYIKWDRDGCEPLEKDEQETLAQNIAAINNLAKPMSKDEVLGFICK